jgi:hypothetical protein
MTFQARTWSNAKISKAIASRRIEFCLQISMAFLMTFAAGLILLQLNVRFGVLTNFERAECEEPDRGFQYLNRASPTLEVSCKSTDR